MRLEEIQ